MLNTVDLIAILPHYLQIILECFDDETVHLHSGDIQTVARVGKVKTGYKRIRSTLLGSHMFRLWFPSL